MKSYCTIPSKYTGINSCNNTLEESTNHKNTTSHKLNNKLSCIQEQSYDNKLSVKDYKHRHAAMPLLNSLA